MNKYLLITLLSIVVSGAMVSCKSKSKFISLNNTGTGLFKVDSIHYATYTPNSNPHGFSSFLNQPQDVIFNSDSKEIVRVKTMPTMSQIDSLIIYVHKSQIRWVNDSTAIIKKR